jgi:hypothetical protein
MSSVVTNSGSTPINVRLPAAPVDVETDFLRLGDYQHPSRTLRVNSRYLELDGQPWLPVMGEFHFSRYPEQEWETELHRMRAGGVNIVASYVFWNHHEEIAGEFDWSGRRDLHRFVGLVQRVGLLFYLRPGPWVHAESRYGGFPNWLIGEGPLRCNDPGYLAHVARFYHEIGAQLSGLLWKDGGPVIGLQLENEYDGIGPGRGAEHIAELKRLAIAAGLTVPLYTVTGWPTLDIPAHDVIPVSGAYPDGFWSGAQGPLPASGVFLFNTSRAIGEMGNVGGTPAAENIDKRHYPFFLAEAGGGMHVSYHRRPVVDADDVAATALVQIGSGASLYGYYMYHGGTNPKSNAGPLNESQDTGYANDVPLLGYDFRAPLGQYGQMRPSYGRLKTLHLFLAAFGSALVRMEAVLSADAPDDPGDRSSLRVAARGAAGSGFLFVNNHVRHHPMPSFANVRFRIEAGDQTIELPHAPVDIASGVYFIWPIGQRIGSAVLRYATAQPLTASRPALRRRSSASPIQISPQSYVSSARRCNGSMRRATGSPETDDVLIVRPPASALAQFVVIVDMQHIRHTIILLPRELAEQCYVFPLHSRERLILCSHGVHGEDDALVVTAPHDEQAKLSIYPSDDLAIVAPASTARAEFVQITVGSGPFDLPTIGVEIVRAAMPPAAPRMGPYFAWRKLVLPAPKTQFAGRARA